MKKGFLYFTVFILTIISLGYIKNGVAIFELVHQSEDNTLFAATNWVVESVDFPIADQINLKKGDSILAINGDKQNDFLALDDDLVANKGNQVSMDVLRNGEQVTITSQIPADLQTNDFEKRLVFKPIFSGNPGTYPLTPYVKNRLGVGELIIFAMALVALITVVLLLLEKQIGWLIGAVIVVVGIYGAITAGGDAKVVARICLFLILGIGLFFSYQKPYKRL